LLFTRLDNSNHAVFACSRGKYLKVLKHDPCKIGITFNKQYITFNLEAITHAFLRHQFRRRLKSQIKTKVITNVLGEEKKHDCSYQNSHCVT